MEHNYILIKQKKEPDLGHTLTKDAKYNILGKIQILHLVLQLN